jgi:hypothetical protein
MLRRRRIETTVSERDEQPSHASSASGRRSSTTRSRPRSPPTRLEAASVEAHGKAELEEERQQRKAAADAAAKQRNELEERAAKAKKEQVKAEAAAEEAERKAAVLAAAPTSAGVESDGLERERTW